LRDRREELEKAGARLIVVGNGGPSFARGFADEFNLSGALLLDPELVAYRAAGLRRGRAELLSPRLVRNGLRAYRSGARQDGVQGDPWQLGGIFVLRPDGALTFRHLSREAGDHPQVDAILDALRSDAPALDETPARADLRAAVGRGLSTLLDPTIALSFDQIGYRVHELTFDPGDLDVDLSGRRCLITGASSGIGYVAAERLADLGARIELLCRDPERGAQAAEKIRAQTGSQRVEVRIADLSDLSSVREIGTALAQEPVDVLVHNAGVLPDSRELTADGLERTLATHLVGPHLLTRLLRSALEAAGAARVVWVSSGGMYTQRLSTRDLNWKQREYDGATAYAQTKRAQVVLSELWADVLRDSGVRVNAMHPGWADTPGVRSSLPNFWRVMRSHLRTPAEGADTIVWLAAAQVAGESSGQFFLDRTPRSTHYLPWTRESDAARERLWTLCEQLADAGGRGLDAPAA
jgi:NAD(P)-dependent dehydrogenase (short-subunit alcohol dehydrogenase family)